MTITEDGSGSPSEQPESFALVWRDREGRLRTAGTLAPADAIELLGEFTSKLPPDVLARLLPVVVGLFGRRK